MKWLLATSLFASACAPSKSCSRHFFGDSSLSIEIEIRKTNGKDLVIDIGYGNMSDSAILFHGLAKAEYTDNAEELRVSMGNKVFDQDMISTGSLVLPSKSYRKVRKVIRDYILRKTILRFDAKYMLFRFSEDGDPLSFEYVEKYGTKSVLKFSSTLTPECLDSLPESDPLFQP